MKLDTLYKRAKTGAVLSWIITQEDDYYYTVSGQLDGKLTRSKNFYCKGKNIGRANETSPSEQAAKVAESKWKKQLERGYVQDPDDLDKNIINKIEPMTARKYGEVDLPDVVMCQPKLDGLRCLITKDRAVSRGNKDWVTIDHIRKALAPIFEKHPHLVLDGELYCHDLHDDFNKITSLVKKTKPTEDDISECARVIQFWWYDIAGTNLTFRERSRLLVSLYIDHVKSPVVVPVQTMECYSKEQLDASYSEYIREGYEGQMVRDPESKYEHKRSKGLLKRKEFMDAEYKIVDVCEGQGNKAGMAGYMILAREDGKTFHSNIKGNHEHLRETLERRDRLVGQYATCKFFELTPDGIPRFPYVIGIRVAPGQDT
jgi:DNA ligase 1